MSVSAYKSVSVQLIVREKCVGDVGDEGAGPTIYSKVQKELL
jgi:hypothetical protein